MDMQKEKEKLLENLAIFDLGITKEEIESASVEQLLEYIELTEKIKARLEIL